MILSIGTDIIEIERIKKAVSKKSFLDKIYTKNELLLFSGKNFAYLAGNFSAKEAVAKAFETGFRNFMPCDIEILRDEKGKPYIVLYRNALNLSKSLNLSKIHITISHCIDYATATAIFEK